MTTYGFEIEDYARLGQVGEERELPSSDVFASQEPFPLEASSFTDEAPIHEAMKAMCRCGHDRYRHWDATDQCDICKDCLGFEEAK